MAQILLKRSFDPITEFLPMSLATKQMQERWEQQRALRHEARSRVGAEEELDLFSREGIKSVVRRRIQVPVEKLASQVQSNIARTARVERVTSLDKSAVDDLLEEDETKPRGSTSAYSVEHRASELHRTPSHRSRSSGKIEKSQKDPDLHPDTSPPATREGLGLDVDDLDKDFDIHGFDHPSTYTEQPWIWIHNDALGISQVLIRDLRQSGVDASDEGANIDAKGTVEVQRGPPDEDWSGGHDA
ncbi:hypothetical protein EIP86_009068 [Pleurotus ostreatoroseus]|nr:hypothetical protein EIP86_009068 [Pleurotus ostreatoroseus]